ncbi:MAG: right-handed parallel beta-helix repeat-containing protein, partial [Gemmatimonadaceae bacterium]
AQRGDEIVLQAGATFTGNFTLPAKSGTVANGWITIRTDKLSQLPPEGVRITPAHAALMPKIVTANSAAALATKLGATGYRIVGVEITVLASYLGPQYSIVSLGDGSNAQNALALVASDLVLDRVYVHGQTTTDTRRCVSLNSARTQITDSYLTDCHSHGFDSQAIHGFNGPGPYKIVNNTLIASTENITFGGADPAITGMIPADIEIRRNYIYTPASWKSVWLKKNLFELKAGLRILVEGNVFDGSWTDGQVGYAFMLKVSNQSGGCTWCTTSDITIRYNLIRNVGAGIEIAGREGSSPYPVGALAARFSVQHNVMENVNVGIFTGDERFIEVVGNASDVEITNNTTTSTGHMGSFLLLDNTYPSVTRLAYNKNATSLAAYGLYAGGRGEGTPALGAVAGGWQFNSNYLIGVTRSGYPAGTTFVASLAAVPSGFGADQATLNTKIAGVIIP